jgi:ELWxxDGT repeat protein
MRAVGLDKEIQMFCHARRNACLITSLAIGVTGELLLMQSPDARGIEIAKVNISQFGDSFPGEIAAVAGRVVAAATLGVDREIYIVDPLTLDPTNPLNNNAVLVNVDAASSSVPMGISAVGGLAFFSATMSSANRELYVIDPLAPGGGATMVDINPAGGSLPTSILEVAAVAGNLAVMSATTAANGRELFIVDPTNLGAGATGVDVNPGAGNSNPNLMIGVDERAVFAATNDGTDIELHVVDPHMPGLGSTEVEINAGGSSNPSAIVGAANLAVFSAFDGTDTEIFIVDPSMAGLGATKVDIVPGAASSHPQFLAAIGDLVVFRGSDILHGTELHILDPTAPGAGTTVVDINPGAIGHSTPANITAVAGRAVFTAFDGTDTELHIVDPLNPTDGSTKIDINPSGSTTVEELIEVAGRAVFKTNLGGDEELYAVDPLFPEYGWVKVDVNPSGSSSAEGLTAVGGRVALAATVDGDTELFVMSFNTTWDTSASGSWEVAANWRGGVAPRMVDDVVIAPDNGLTVTAPSGESAVGSVTVGAASGTATLQLPGGTIRTHHATINVGGRLAGSGTLVTDVGSVVNHGTIDLAQGLHIDGGALENHGDILAGNGSIGATLDNEETGRVRAAADQHLVLTGMGNTNLGEIILLGGTVEFTDDLLNERMGVDNGLISGRGTLFVQAGLTNDGVMNFSGGLTDIFGDVDNTATGQVVNSGGSTLTFFDDVVNNGDIRTTAGSTTVFFGAYSGGGTITGIGTASFEGDLSPGNSAAAIVFGTSVELRPTSSLIIELGGTERGTQYDAIDVEGVITLGGTLEVSLVDSGDGLFSPQAGDTFSIVTSDVAISGQFDSVQLPALGTLLQWHLNASAQELLLAVTVAGDFNQDGVVGAADYVLWRNSEGGSDLVPSADANGDGAVNSADYEVWRQNFGLTAAALGSMVGTTVPEPTTSVLVIAPLLATGGVRRRRHSMDAATCGIDLTWPDGRRIPGL